MTEPTLSEIKALLANCTPEEKETLFRDLLKEHSVHKYEDVVGASAETILAAIDIAPELTRRMLRGVIADAAFGTEVVPKLTPNGWKDTTDRDRNETWDYLLAHPDHGEVKVQVKLQRSEKGDPVELPGKSYFQPDPVYMVEVQKTRTGKDKKEGKDTRPYVYSDFDIIAVSMQPSSPDHRAWGKFMYAPASTLISAHSLDETFDTDRIATVQPVSKEPDGVWTLDFEEAVARLRDPKITDRQMKSSKPQLTKEVKAARILKKALKKAHEEIADAEKSAVEANPNLKLPLGDEGGENAEDE